MEQVFIYTGNHYHAVGIQDLVTMIRNGARDAGFEASVTDLPVPGRCMVFIEHFIDPSHWHAVRDARAAGCRCVIVGTELISRDGFNRGLGVGSGHYADVDYWRRRHAGFLAAAEHADEIWVVAEAAVPAYRDALPGLPVRVLPHGWVSGMDGVVHLPEARKDIDFFFSGSLTPMRESVLSALARRHRVSLCPQGGPDYLRLDLLARTRVCLSLPLSADNRLPSVSRLHFHLQNANFVLQLAYRDGCPLDRYVLHAPAEDFVEWAVAALEIGNRREIAEGARDRFRAEMPLSRWIGPLLERAPTPRVRAQDAVVHAA